MGTLRFGNDPTTSVCDANGRLHDVGNLYAADGALYEAKEAGRDRVKSVGT